MPLDLASEMWSELKRYVNNVDRNDAAETLVNVLIENGYDSEEIKAAFKGDSDVKKFLNAYIDDDQTDDDDYDDEYDDESDYNY